MTKITLSGVFGERWLPPPIARLIDSDLTSVDQTRNIARSAQKSYPEIYSWRWSDHEYPGVVSRTRRHKAGKDRWGDDGCHQPRAGEITIGGGEANAGNDRGGRQPYGCAG